MRRFSLRFLPTLFLLAGSLVSCRRGAGMLLLSSPSPTFSPSPSPTATTTASPSREQPALLLSLTEGNAIHLFAYSSTLPLTRLTADSWDDITPAISPDGKRIAYASRRNGYWDLYLLTLADGTVSRLSDTPEYEGAPSWSSDGLWLVYEAYVDGNLELFVRSVTDNHQAPIRVTDDAFTDRSPAWAPPPHQQWVAFVSNRSGQDDIWIADLGRAGEERFLNLSRSPRSVESHPAWSPDGNLLAWGAVSEETGLAGIYVWDSRAPDNPPRWAGSGHWPVWLDETHIAALIAAPNNSFVTVYAWPEGTLTLPPTPIPGTPYGLTVLPGGLLQPLPEPFRQAAERASAPLYLPQISQNQDIPGGRATLVDIPNIQAPYPQLHDAADEAFQALRQRVAEVAGWDALAALSNAFVPLTVPLEPGLSEDWLYTGRAFALNPLLLNAGWMVIGREDFGLQTYWRVYLRVLAQDGSMGLPLRQIPWDLTARYNRDPAVYDQGGQWAPTTPAGYWLDLTALAREYGWERLPATANWRSYFQGARCSEFVFRQGLDWQTAMLQLYPPDIFVTPTVVIPPTRTPTRTPWHWVSPTPSLTPSPRPTFTPSP